MKPYYDQGGITIYHGDCRDVVPQLPMVGLVLTDPPYGTEDLGGGYGRRQLHSPNGRLGRVIVGDKDLSVVQEAFPLVSSRLVPGGSLATFAAPRRMFEVHQIVVGTGLNYLGEVVWDKGAPGLGYTIRYSHESCLIFYRDLREKPIEPLLSVVRESVDHLNARERHPHQKPPQFWINLLRLHDGVVLDPFMGSGGVLRAAKDLGRPAIGIEVEEKWCELAVRKLAQESLFSGGTSTAAPQSMKLPGIESAPSAEAPGLSA